MRTTENLETGNWVETRKLYVLSPVVARNIYTTGKPPELSTVVGENMFIVYTLQT